MQKRFLGEIMQELGFINFDQLERSLKKQKELVTQKSIPELLQRYKLIREARMTRNGGSIPAFGKVLRDMGFATEEQLEKALKIQGSFWDYYKNISSEKLGVAVATMSMINSTLNLAEVLAHLMQHANGVINSVAGTLMLLDPKTKELVFSVPTGPKSNQLVDIRLPSNAGIAGWVAETGQYELVPDVDRDSRFYPEIDKTTGMKTTSILCVPLKAKSKTIGVLEMINKVDDSAFSEQDALLVGIFASQASMAIENARLYGELKNHLKEEREIQGKLSETEKFNVLGQMASGFAHDFNNILGAIMGYVKLVDLKKNHKESARW